MLKFVGHLVKEEGGGVAGECEEAGVSLELGYKRGVLLQIKGFGDSYSYVLRELGPKIKSVFQNILESKSKIFFEFQNYLNKKI